MRRVTEGINEGFIYIMNLHINMYSNCISLCVDQPLPPSDPFCHVVFLESLSQNDVRCNPSGLLSGHGCSKLFPSGVIFVHLGV